MRIVDTGFLSLAGRWAKLEAVGSKLHPLPRCSHFKIGPAVRGLRHAIKCNFSHDENTFRPNDTFDCLYGQTIFATGLQVRRLRPFESAPDLLLPSLPT